MKKVSESPAEKAWFRILSLVLFWSSAWYSQKKDQLSGLCFFLNAFWINLTSFLVFHFLSFIALYSLSCLAFFCKTARFSARSVTDLRTKSYIWPLLWSEICDRTLNTWVENAMQCKFHFFTRDQQSYSAGSEFVCWICFQ